MACTNRWCCAQSPSSFWFTIWYTAQNTEHAQALCLLPTHVYYPSVQAHWHLLWVSFWSLSKIEKKPIIMSSIRYFSHFSTTSLPPSLGTKSATENRLWSFSDIELSSGFKEGMFPQLLLLLYQFQSPKPHNIWMHAAENCLPHSRDFASFCWMREKGTWKKER